MPAAFPFQPVSKTSGVLLVGHGTDDPRGREEFFDVARRITEICRDYIVEPCFLELAQPDIPTGIGRLLGQGICELTVAPLLLFAAGHAKRDIPSAVRESLQKAETGGRALPKNKVHQTTPLECHERIVELSAQRYGEALFGRPHAEPQDTLLLMVGRGSSEATAIAAMHRFVELRVERTPVGSALVGFVVVAWPTLNEALAAAAETKFQRVVVQPHLLFAGKVLGQITEAVNKFAANERQRQWIVAPHLGASPLVAQAVIDLLQTRKPLAS